MRGFFSDIMKAVSEFKFYKQAKDFQTSRVLKYFFLMVLLITLALVARFTYDMSRGLDMAVDWSLENLPAIEIENGTASVDVKEPYMLEGDDFVFIIDTTGGITSLDDYETGILLTKNEIQYKEGGFKTERYDLSRFGSLRIDENFLKALRKNIMWIIFPFALAIIFVYISVARILHVFIFSLISLAASSIADAKLTYRQLFNIGIYAITPSAVLGALVAVIGFNIPHFVILYIGLYTAYLITAVMNCKEKPAPTP